MITKQTNKLINTIADLYPKNEIKKQCVLTLTEAYKQELEFLNIFFEDYTGDIKYLEWIQQRREELKDSIKQMEEIKWML